MINVTIEQEVTSAPLTLAPGQVTLTSAPLTLAPGQVTLTSGLPTLTPGQVQYVSSAQEPTYLIDPGEVLLDLAGNVISLPQAEVGQYVGQVVVSEEPGVTSGLVVDGANVDLTQVAMVTGGEDISASVTPPIYQPPAA